MGIICVCCRRSFVHYPEPEFVDRADYPSYDHPYDNSKTRSRSYQIENSRRSRSYERNNNSRTIGSFEYDNEAAYDEAAYDEAAYGDAVAYSNWQGRRLPRS